MRITVRGLSMFARVATAAGADAPPIVLVHGVAVSSRNMVPSAELLAADYRVFAVDLPGHGNSDHPSRPLDTWEHAETLQAWLEAVGVPAAVLVGNSYGCQVIAELAVRYPRSVAATVLQGPTVDGFARTRGRQLARWLVNATREASAQQLALFTDWRQAGLRTMLHGGRHMFEHRIETVLPGVLAPTLVVRGERDPLVSQEWAEHVTELLPNGRLAVVPNAAHTIPFKYPEELARLVRDFVRDLSTWRG
jgi:pimeloyl-ACP methyl ester carboxylesterase